MTQKKAYKILRNAGYGVDEYRWLKSSALYAFAYRVSKQVLSEIRGVDGE
jgi:hypothetical protein